MFARSHSFRQSAAAMKRSLLADLFLWLTVLLLFLLCDRSQHPSSVPRKILSTKADLSASPRQNGRDSPLAYSTAAPVDGGVEKRLLQSLGVCCDVSKGVAYHRSRYLICLVFVGEVSLFMSASFRSSTCSLIVNTCTKAIVERWGCLGSTPSTIKLAKQSIGV
ncbi:hypothetical protein B296_00013656 [Ensete ventricosum]|uniref:Uncharacterized protein n=1 Tax=Ensete ventricosum TaxID=4639 RepID=A0A426Z4C6_ENSVE|nr:hypothetical protein B296_00013656 [Ensete ventricosum]